MQLRYNGKPSWKGAGKSIRGEARKEKVIFVETLG